MSAEPFLPRYIQVLTFLNEISVEAPGTQTKFLIGSEIPLVRLHCRYVARGVSRFVILYDDSS